MTRWRARAGAWLAVAMVAVAFALLAAGEDGVERLRSEPLLSLGAAAVGAALAGSIVADRAPLIGGLLLLDGVLTASALGAHEYGHFALLERDGELPLGRAAAVAGWTLWAPGFGIVLVLLPLVFPDGRLLGRRWWPVIGVALGGTALAMIGSFGAAVLASTEDLFDGETPAGRAGDLSRLADVGRMLIFAGAVPAVASLVVRYRRADLVVRRQLLWLVTGFAATVVLIGAALVVDTAWLAFEVLGVLALPAALAVAITRHGLWDIERLVSRAALYLGMSALVGLGYLVVIAAGASIFRDRSSAGAAVIAAAVIAIAFQPARERLQTSVDRIIYGARRSPVSALASLRARIGVERGVEPLLAAVAASVREDLRLGYVAIDVSGRPDLAAENGTARPGPAFPLIVDGGTVGSLRVAAAPGDQLGELERTTLEAVAGLVALVVFASRLMDDVRTSREAIVVAREEERRRLRRDLHDGLGPALAGLGLQASAVANLVRTDPGEARALAKRMSTEAVEIARGVRRLVEGLRPPALDELGLVRAIEQVADVIVSDNTGALDIVVRSEGDLGGLPAAAEVAAYRIATEALTNVRRHAGASRCEVLVRRDGCLHLEVRDDGSGISPDSRAGVGLISMRERIEELGGRFTVDSGPKGTAIRVEVPIR